VAGDGAVVGLELDAADLDVIMEVRRDLRVQLEAAPLAAQALLEALGVDLTRAGMAATPARMARACRNGLPSRSLSG
jgi:GTP cyclohydrolase I